jgi:hypothetical protein
MRKKVCGSVFPVIAKVQTVTFQLNSFRLSDGWPVIDVDVGRGLAIAMYQ